MNLLNDIFFFQWFIIEYPIEGEFPKINGVGSPVHDKLTDSSSHSR